MLQQHMIFINSHGQVIRSINIVFFEIFHKTTTAPGVHAAATPMDFYTPPRRKVSRRRVHFSILKKWPNISCPMSQLCHCCVTVLSPWRHSCASLATLFCHPSVILASLCYNCMRNRTNFILRQYMYDNLSRKFVDISNHIFISNQAYST